MTRIWFNNTIMSVTTQKNGQKKAEILLYLNINISRVYEIEPSGEKKRYVPIMLKIKNIVIRLL